MKSPRLPLLLILLAIASPAFANSGTPLVVVRFNQPKVFYQKPLYTAVSRAVAIKPDVTFDVISYNPKVGSDKIEAETAQFVSDLTGMGIPKERIHVERQSMNDSSIHEIYLYVD